MKMLRMFLAWPLTFAVTWYFLDFQAAAIVALVYLHVITILLFQITEKHKEKLVQIVEYIKEKDGLIDPQALVDPLNIETADSLVDAILKINKR